jgi:hypothetical protein
LAQLPQIPHLIASTEPFRDDVINVHLAFSLATHLATSITPEHHLSDSTPSACAAAFPCFAH